MSFQRRNSRIQDVRSLIHVRQTQNLKEATLANPIVELDYSDLKGLGLASVVSIGVNKSRQLVQVPFRDPFNQATTTNVL
jgi:hypothetical protein